MNFSILKLTQIIHIFSHFPIKSSFNQLKAFSEEAKLTKNTRIHDFIYNYNDFIRGYIDKWHKIAENDKNQAKIYKILSFFENLHEIVACNHKDLLFITPEERKTQKKIYKKLAEITNFIVLREKQRVFISFRENAMKNKGVLGIFPFFEKILHKNIKFAFNKIKGFSSVYHNFQEKKAVKFIVILKKITKIPFFSSFEKFKSLNNDAIFSKGFHMKNLLKNMINMSKTRIFKWKLISVFEKQSDKLMYFMRFFENLNTQNTTNLQDLFEYNSKSDIILSEILKKSQFFMKNLVFNAFWRWKEKNREISSKIRIFEEFLKKMHENLTNYENSKIKAFLLKFKQNAENSKLIYRFHDRLSLKVYQNLKKTFQKWKYLRFSTDKAQLPLHNLINSLTQLSSKPLKNTFEALKNQFSLEKHYKSSILTKYIQNQKKNLGSRLSQWKICVDIEKQRKLNKEIFNFFDLLHEKIVFSVKDFLIEARLENKEESKKRDFLRKILRNFDKKLKDAFERWKYFKDIQEIKGNLLLKGKYDAIKSIKTVIIHRNLKGILDKFMNNMKKTSFLDKILVKMGDNNEKLVRKGFFLLLNNGIVIIS